MPKQTKKKLKTSKNSKKIKKTKTSNKIIKVIKLKNIKQLKNNNYDDTPDLSIEEKSLLDLKKSKSFSVATTLSEYKSKSIIGEIYDYKLLHDKINNICINKIMKKEPKLNKKNSKEICECMFEKNKDLSINDLESRITKKIDIPSTHCITILDKVVNMKNRQHSNSNSKSNLKSKSKSSN